MNRVTTVAAHRIGKREVQKLTIVDLEDRWRYYCVLDGIGASRRQSSLSGGMRMPIRRLFGAEDRVDVLFTTL
jgi:hypothetical protein